MYRSSQGITRLYVFPKRRLVTAPRIAATTMAATLLVLGACTAADRLIPAHDPLEAGTTTAAGEAAALPDVSADAVAEETMVSVFDGGASIYARVDGPIDGPAWANVAFDEKSNQLCVVASDGGAALTIEDGGPRQLKTKGGALVRGAHACARATPYLEPCYTRESAITCVTQCCCEVCLDEESDDAGVAIVNLFESATTFSQVANLDPETHPRLLLLDRGNETAPAKLHARIFWQPDASTRTVAEFPLGTRVRGLAATKDFEAYYVGLGASSTAPPTILKFVPRADGAIDRLTLITLPSGDDALGLALDADGRIYVAWEKGVDVYRADGTRIGGHPGVAIAGTTNIAFGGKEHTSLFVTTVSGEVLVLQSLTPGVLP